MADERQELDRLRKMKRLRELESREVQNVNIHDGVLGLSGTDIVTKQSSQQRVETENGVFSTIGEFLTGSER